MSLMDKIMDKMKLNTDDDDDFEDDDYEEEVPAKKAVVRKETDDSSDYDEDETVRKSAIRSVGRKKPMKNGNSASEIVMIKPTSFDRACEITDTLLSNRTVVLNLEGIDFEIAQRIIDFAYGSTYALKGSLQEISHYIFIIAPADVEISSEDQDALSSGSFDLPFRK